MRASWSGVGVVIVRSKWRALAHIINTYRVIFRMSPFRSTSHFVYDWKSKSNWTVSIECLKYMLKPLCEFALAQNTLHWPMPWLRGVWIAFGLKHYLHDASRVCTSMIARCLCQSINLTHLRFRFHWITRNKKTYRQYDGVRARLRVLYTSHTRAHSEPTVACLCERWACECTESVRRTST